MSESSSAVAVQNSNEGTRANGRIGGGEVRSESPFFSFVLSSEWGGPGRGKPGRAILHLHLTRLIFSKRPCPCLSTGMRCERHNSVRSLSQRVN